MNGLFYASAMFNAVAPVTGGARIISAHSGTPIIAAKWIGDTLGTASIAVNSDGDIALTTDGTTADTTLGLADVGTIDVSDTSTDTVGEILDDFNSSANWQAIMLGGLRDDIGTDAIYTTSETTDCCKNEGVVLLADPAIAMRTSVYGNIAMPITANKFGKGNTVVHDYDYGGYINQLYYLDCNLTYASGTAYIDIYECDDMNNTDTLIARLPAAATTVQKTWGTGEFPLISASRGKRLVVRPQGTAAFTAAYITITGRSYNPDLVPY